MFSRISKFFLYAALFNVVVVLTSTFFPFIGGKYYFFRVAVELAAIFFILWWAYQEKEGEVEKRLKWALAQPLFIAVSCFVLVMLIASIFAYDPLAAFWSNYERGDGAFQLLHYYAFFLLLILSFKSIVEWRHILKIVLVASSLLITYGIGAALRIPHFIGPELCGRFQGSLGNPAYVAPYLMFTIFFTLYLFSSHHDKAVVNKKALLIGGGSGSAALLLLVVLNSSLASSFALPYQNYAAEHFSLNLLLTIAAYSILPIFYLIYLRRSGSSWKNSAIGFSYVAFLSFFFFFFMLTQTRGTFLGLGVAVIAWLAYSLFVLRKKIIRLFIAGLLVFTILLGLGAFLLKKENLPLVPFCSSSSRLANFSSEEGGAQARFWTWGSAFKGWQERPILGWGPENFSVVFDKYFDSRHFVPDKSSETWFDRAHNVFLEYLVEAGLLGLLSYLAIFAIFYWQFFLNFRVREDNAGRYEGTEQKSNIKKQLTIFSAGVLFSLPIGYLVQGVALFDVLAIYQPLFLFLAFSVFLMNSHESTS